MTHLIDYAGLFPPAKLDMGPTVRNYASYMQSDDAWMLGRLIVPVARLDEFEHVAEALLPGDDDEQWLISALTVPAGDPKLSRDMERIARFNQEHAGRAAVDVIELKAGSSEAIESALDAIPDEVFAFFELPVDRDPRGLLASLPGSDAGAKIRTGGMTPEQYPAPAQVARFIRACVDAQLPFKATAGLHHPLLHRNETVGADEFGFLGVFLGACLADVLPGDELMELLREGNPDALKFDDAGVTWREHSVPTAKIAQVRERTAIAFGSCSFDEPREDLRVMTLL